MTATRKFHLGSEWLYFKIYTGVKTSDIILVEVIKPLFKQLKNEHLIKKWFFIRYNDPQSHLRIRLNIKNLSDYSYILENINSLFNEYLESGEISDIVIDSYKRELERYGENTIEYAEDFFFRSSELILSFLEYDDDEKIMLSLFYIDCILSGLKLSMEEKLKWIQNFNRSFKTEFNADKNLNNQLKKKYTEFIPKYFDFISSLENIKIRNLIENNLFEIKLILKKILELEMCGSLKVSIEYFFQSIFHMHINRLFFSDQRLFELIVYDYLLRFYKIKFIKQKSILRTSD